MRYKYIKKEVYFKEFADGDPEDRQIQNLKGRLAGWKPTVQSKIWRAH